MKPDRKPNGNSKLDGMPESRVLELRDKLLAGDTYQDCLSWLAAECAVASTLSALSAFYKRHCWPVIRERRQVSVIKAEALGAAMAKDPVNWDDKIIERTKQLAFEFLSTDRNDPEEISTLLNAIVKAKKQDFTETIQTRKQDVEERKLKIIEEKAAEAKAKLQALTTAAKSQGGLSPETLAAIEEAAGLL